jgi:hypothetical protein
LLRKTGYAHCCGRWVILIAADDGLYALLRKMVILIVAEDELHLFCHRKSHRKSHLKDTATK